MRIYKDTFIKISGKISPSSPLFKLKEGSIIKGKLVEKMGPRTAILDLGGSRVRAEFLTGLPKNKNLTLILQEKTPSLIKLKLLHKDGNINLLKDIVKFTVFDEDYNDKKGPLKLSIKDGFNSIYQLNKLIIKIISGHSFKDNDLIGFLNKMLKKGFSRENLEFFSYIFSNRPGINIYSLFSILALPGLPGKGKIKDLVNDDNDKSQSGDRIKDLISQLSNFIEEDKDKEKLIKEFLNLLTENNSPSEDGPFLFEIPYFDSDQFKGIECILYRGNFLLSFELSRLGKLEILFKDDSRNMEITFFCNDEDSLKALKGDISGLYSSLKDYYKNKLDIRFLVAGNIIGKIIEINSLMLLNSQVLDIKA